MNIADLELDAVAEAIEEAGYTVGALRIRQVIREFEKLTLELAAKVADHEADKRSLTWCGEQIAACAEYLKEGETVAECIARNRRDVDGMLGALAKERLRVEKLERENAALRSDIERHVKIASEQATELAELRSKLEAERDKYLKLSEAYEGCDLELKEAQRNAERYQAMRARIYYHHNPLGVEWCFHSNKQLTSKPSAAEMLDDAADAAMHEVKP